MLLAGQLHDAIKGYLAPSVNVFDSYMAFDGFAFDYFVSHVPSPSAYLVLTKRHSSRVTFNPVSSFLDALKRVPSDTPVISETDEYLSLTINRFDGGIYCFDVVTTGAE